jgi:hypothetical protein
MVKDTSPASPLPQSLFQLLTTLAVFRHDAKALEKALRIDGVPVVILEFLCAALHVAGEAFRLAPPKMSVRMFLADILAALPSYGTDQNLFRLRARASSVIKLSDEDLMDSPCEEWADFLLQEASWLKNSLDRDGDRAERARGSNPSLRSDNSRSHPSLPVPFRFGRKTYPFPRSQSHLLDYLYSALRDAERLQAEAPEDEYFDLEAIENRGAVSVEELIDATAGLLTTLGSLRKLQHDTNANLLKFKLPLKIVRPIPGYLLLKRLPRKPR